MVRNSSSRRPKLAVEPETPPAHSTNPKPGSKRSMSHANGPTRNWSKCDVIFIMNGIVDFIAQKSVDPFDHLDSFIKFINNNYSSCNWNVLKKITCHLRKSDNNCVLHLEGNNVCGNSSLSSSMYVRKVDNKGSVVGCGEKESILGKYGGEISVPNSVKKRTFAENESILEKYNGGVSCSSIENVGGNNCMQTLENMEKNSSVGGEKSKSRSRVRRKATMVLVGEESIREANEGNGKEKIGGESPILEVEKGGMKNKNGVNLSDFGFCDKNEVMLETTSRARMDYGEGKCTKTQNNMEKKSGSVGVIKDSKFGAKVTRKTTITSEGKKAILKAKKDDGKKQKNKKKNIGGENPILINLKKGGMKNNNSGCGKMRFRQKCTKTQTNKMETSGNVGLKKSKLGVRISRKVKVGEKAIPKVNDLFWCPPKKGVLKWNTDASVKKDDRTAAIGGVLRDCQGSFRCVFSCRVNCFDVNEAELRAIYKALKLASRKDCLLRVSLVIESDSMAAVTWCNKDNGGPLNWRRMLLFIRKCRTSWPGLEITYMGRKSNSVADSLARQGHQRRVDFVNWIM